MDVDKIFHVKGGDGETSYSQNSSLQKSNSDLVKHITMGAIKEVYYLSKNPQNITVADLGCSSGPNSLFFIRDLYQTVEDAYHNKSEINGPKYSSPPKLSVYLNDLPSNDFNSVFKALPGLYDEISGGGGDGNLSHAEGHNRPSLFVAATPGSFYGRLFHPNFLDFVHSSFSLHWLSKVPRGIYDSDGRSMNKGCIYICEKSPKTVIQAYQDQFQEDFSRFLSVRSQELIKGGKMVLIFVGRHGSNPVDRDSSFVWQLLAQSFSILISKNLVEEEKLNSYEVHYYAPCKEEVEQAVIKEGSFTLELEQRAIKWEDGENVEGEVRVNYGVRLAKTVRAIQESMISHHFGEHILESLFETFTHLADQEMSKQEIRSLTFLLVLTKL